MTRVLVTGASGFIGSHLVDALRNTNEYQVISKNSTDGDVALEATWSTYPECDVLIHLASKTFVPASWESPLNFFQNNLLGCANGLDYCKRLGAKMIFLSSYLYGNPKNLPISEEAELITLNPYALSKKLAEDICNFYKKSFGLEVTIIRPFNIYGPGQDDNFLIPSILKQIDEGQQIEVKDLEPKRDYVYIKDVVSAILKSIKSDSDTFNIGSGISYSVNDLIKIIQYVRKSNLRVHSTGERRKDEIMDTVADISKAKRVLSWAPSFTLKDGIREVICSKINKE